tara:strand:- start:1303 stop:2019 length:717 start_codon:yes stop_codon:yes gene_type:complete
MRKILIYSFLFIVIFISWSYFHHFSFNDLKKLIYSCTEIFINNKNFKVTEIKFSNIKNIEIDQLNDVVKHYNNKNILDINFKKMGEELLKIKEIESLKINLYRGGEINISIYEKKPFFIWKYENFQKVLSIEGEILNLKKKNYKNLLQLYGFGAQENIKYFYKIVRKNEQFGNLIKSIEYIENYRWNIVLENNTLIKLSEKNYKKNLKTLEKFFKNKELLNMSHKMIDFRVDNRISFE